MNSTNNKNSTTIKATLGQKHRLVNIPSSGSERFSILVQRLQKKFAMGSAPFTLTYIDIEGDRVSISSEEELSCALGVASSSSRLHLFITNEAGQDDQVKRENKESPVDQSQADVVAALVAKLEKESGIIITSDTPAAERRCQRLIVKFNGDLDRAAEAIRKWNDNRQARIATRRPDAPDREARRKEKIASRLARQQQRQERKTKQRAEETKKQQAELPNVDELLSELASKGFGADHADTKVAERITKRNSRLLKKFGGDVEQVAALLSARREAAEERRAKRKMLRPATEIAC